ncbi:unnamed protein product, partial [Thelazia callipaeda]|uniref:GRIP domain-containing protein n=1 Tax=Thelazia callipaeda TaxID=103827 RepID=A0A0N5DC79_THECL
MSEEFEECQKNLTECEQKLKYLEKHHSSDKEVLKMKEAEIKDWEAKFRDLQAVLAVQEERVKKAEEEANNNQLQVCDLNIQLDFLRKQSEQKHDNNEMIQALREELKQAKRKIVAQAADLEKAELDADEAERSSRETIGELEEEMLSLQEKLKILEIDEKRQTECLMIAEEEKRKLQEANNECEKKCGMLTKDLEEIRAALIDSEHILEKLKLDNEKLSAKASLEDEVLTLATSLQSARNEIRHVKKIVNEIRQQYEQRIEILKKEVKELKSCGDEKIKELFSVVMKSLRKELAISHDIELYKNRQDSVIDSEKMIDIDSFSKFDFDVDLRALKECIAEVMEEKLASNQRNDSELVMMNKLTQTVLPVNFHDKSSIFMNEKEEEEEAREHLDEEVLMLRQKIHEFEIGESENDKSSAVMINEYTSANLNSQVWNLRAELSSLKKEISEEERNKKRLQKHIQELQNTIHNKEANLIIMDSVEEENMKKENSEGESFVEETDDKIILQNSLNNLKKLLKQTADGKEAAEKALTMATKFQEKLVDDLRDRLKLAEEEKVSLKKDLRSDRKFITDVNSEENERENLKVESESVQVLSQGISSNLEKRLRSAEQQVEMLKFELAEAQKYAKVCKYEVEEKNLDIANFAMDIQSLKNELKVCKMHQEEINHLEDRNKVLEFENKNLNNENSSLKEMLNDIRESQITMKNQQISNYALEIKATSEDLKQSREAYEMLKLEMHGLCEQHSESLKEVNRMKNLLDMANVEKEQLKAEAHNRRAEAERLSRERLELELTRQRLDEAIAEGERQTRELAQIKAQTKTDEKLEKDRQQEILHLRQQIDSIQ